MIIRHARSQQEAEADKKEGPSSRITSGVKLVIDGQTRFFEPDQKIGSHQLLLSKGAKQQIQIDRTCPPVQLLVKG